MVQERILKQHPDLAFPVYCLWLPVLRQYTAEEIARAMPKLLKRFYDPRFVHYWDGTDVVGRYFKKHIIPDYATSGAFWDSGDVVWDTFVMFNRKGKWSAARDHLNGWGRTIQGEFDKLNGLVADMQK